MDDREFLNYTAGFFDADGTVGVYWHRDETSSRGGGLHLHAGITQKFYMPIFAEWQNRWGGSLVPSRKKHPSWKWDVSNHKALSFLEAICPFVRKKKGQVDLAIQFQRHKAARGSAPHLTNKEFAWQKTIAETMKEMKRSADPGTENVLRQIRRTIMELSGQLELWPEDRCAKREAVL